MKEIINFLRLLWELPQNLLGFILFQVYSLDCMCMEVTYGDVRILYSERMKGGISLGRFIILPWRYRGDYSKGSYIEMSHMHEWGHTRQSLYLGWLYLVVIGLPSLLWAWAHSAFRRLRTVDYYSFWTERWADRLGGVRR
jgi:hypothetical protein